MKAEKVTIHLSRGVAVVVAEFEFDVSEAPPLKYCRPLPGGGTKCGEPYFQFRMLWPVLEGQKERIQGFKAFFNEQKSGHFSPRYRKVADLPYPMWAKVDSPSMREKKLETLNVRIRDIETLPMQDGKADFTYVLRTGALWKGNIGEAEIEVVVGEEMAVEAMSMEPTEQRDNVLRWVLRDFEPTAGFFLTVRSVDLK